MRYNGLTVVNPNFLSSSTSFGAGTPNPQPMTANEFCFWFRRISTLHLAGTFTYDSITDVISQDVSAVDTSAVEISAEPACWTQGPTFACSIKDSRFDPDEPSLNFNLNALAVLHDGKDDAKLWYPSWFTEKIRLTSESTLFSTTNFSGSVPSSNDDIKVNLTDPITHSVYNYVVPTFVFPSGGTYSGNLVLTATAFFPYVDAESNPLYNTSTGAYANL